MFRTPRAAIGACLQIMLAAALADDALAHARLKRANPPVGGTVSAKSVPTEVQVWFSEKVEPALSSIQVANSAGNRVDKGDVRADPADQTQLRVTLLPLSPGLYRVTWRVVSTDTHTTSGSFPFRVRGTSRPRLNRAN